MYLEWMYLVPMGSPIVRPSDADRPGVRIATYEGTPLHLYLKRSLKNATLIATANDQRSIELVNMGEADVVAASMNQLGRFANQMPGGTLIQEPMFISRHAIAVAIGRDDILNFATGWVERAKSRGCWRTWSLAAARAVPRSRRRVPKLGSGPR